jgi:phospholipid/cholesterol/gamma-HCH transport system ATP-binding protein
MIQLIDVHKSFGAKRVLSGFTLDVVEGETMVIIGYSGTGKSVAIKHIVGLLEPDRGTVIVDGLEVPNLKRRELYDLRARIGYVFQFAALFDSMTVAGNIRLGLVKRGYDEGEIRERIEESLAVVELPGLEDKYPAELSGGMRKRVGIARAIALKPRYILYDEPTTGLDPVTSAVMDQLMIRTRDLGVTGLVVTHDMRSAFSVGDRIAMLYEGSIRQVGTVAEIQATEDPVVRQFIEGRPGSPAPAPAWRFE